jgi:hypothetical protein
LFFGICYLEFPLPQLLHEWIRKSFATKNTKSFFDVLQRHQ